MIRVPKRIFKIIFDLRRARGSFKTLWTPVGKIVSLVRNFWQLCLCVQILFDGVRGPKKAERVIPVWEKLPDLAPIPASLGKRFWVNQKSWYSPQKYYGPYPLKDLSVFPYRGRGNAYFFWTSKFIISGLECRRMFKLVLAHTMDTSGPFWATHPTKKYVLTKAHPLENFRRKNVFFADQAGLGPRWGAKCQKC